MTQEDRPKPGGDFERIEPVELPSAAEVRPEPAPPPPSPSRGPWIGLGLLGALALFVTLWEPSAESPAAAPQPPTSSEAAPDPTEASAAAPALDVEAILAARVRAEAATEALASAIAALEGRGIEGWNLAGLRELRGHRDEAGRHFESRAYSQAQAEAERGVARATALGEEADRRLPEALAEGNRALDDARPEAAAEAFARALAIDPANAEAQVGAKRAASLPAVLEQLAAGREREGRGELDAARDAFERGGALDPAHRETAEALARVEAAILERDFRRHMSRGLAALEQGRLESARSELGAARRLRPKAPEVRDALGRANARSRSARLGELRRDAEAAEAREDWAGALAHYESALALDDTLVFARDGERRSRRRADLDTALDRHLRHPERLAEESVRTEVAALLQRAAETAPSGPKLERQVAALRSTLERATTPLRVTLRSDGRTEVLLYRVGKLGRFEQKELSLTPGDYTAIGRRPGFRDVRRRFRVTTAGESVDIRCEEAI